MIAKIRKDSHASVMTDSITIHQVPAATRRALEDRARQQNQTLQEFLLQTLASVAQPGDLDAWLRRVNTRRQACGLSLDRQEILALRDAGRR